MTDIFVDIEADGPVPGLYSMHDFGAVVINKDYAGNLVIGDTFRGQCRPISDNYIEEALAVSHYTREDTLALDDPEMTIERFLAFLDDQYIKGNKTRLHFWSDNNGFDWSFIAYYLHRFGKRNPFGHTSCNVSYFYKGVIKNTRENWARFRRKHSTTPHDHNPVNDAMSNAQAFIKLKEMHRFK